MSETGYQTDPAEPDTTGDDPATGDVDRVTGDEDPAAISGDPATDDESALADDGVAGPGDTASPSWFHRLRWVLPWVLVVLAVAVAVVSTWQWQQLATEERQRDEVAQSAGTFMLTLTNWDATEGMGAVREELRAHGTQRFAGEVDELFGTTEDLRELADIGARSDGEVRRFFVQELDDDRAVALVVLVQRLVTDVTEGEEVSVRYAELDLLRRDSTWLVDEVELLVDVAQQEAQPIAPDADDAQEAP